MALILTLIVLAKLARMSTLALTSPLGTITSGLALGSAAWGGQTLCLRSNL